MLIIVNMKDGVSNNKCQIFLTWRVNRFIEDYRLTLPYTPNFSVFPKHRRHRLTHLEEVAPLDYDRFVKLDVKGYFESYQSRH
jgi:hypothetical protein